MAKQTKEEKAAKQALYAKTPRGRFARRQINLRYQFSEKGAAAGKKRTDKWNAKKKREREALALKTNSLIQSCVGLTE